MNNIDYLRFLLNIINEWMSKIKKIKKRNC